jgi:DNA-binding response OmpR family regulator
MAFILVVEDDVDTQALMVKVLEGEGHTVYGTANCKAAMVAAKIVRFDLMISDRRLPDCDGLELIQKLQELYPVPAIVVSGDALSLDELQRAQPATSVWLQKPIRVEKFTLCINNALRRGKAMDGSTN